MISKNVLPRVKEIFHFLNLKSANKVSLDVPTLTEFQDMFNVRLEKCLDVKLAKYNSIVQVPIALETLTHAASLVRQGGKRVRPYLCFLTYCGEGGTD